MRASFLNHFQTFLIVFILPALKNTFFSFSTIGTSCQLIEGQVSSYSFWKFHFDFSQMENESSDVVG
jgi:hypothetical protein